MAVNNDNNNFLLNAVVDGTLTVEQIQLASSKETLQNSPVYSGCTLLYWAICKCSTKVVEALVEKGLDVNEKSSYEMTPSHIAASMSRWDILILLHQRGANMLTVNSHKWTVLHFAAWNGAPQHIIELLIENCKIDPTSQDSIGQTAQDYAIQHNHLEIARFIKQFCKPTKSANLVV
jgi:ankyrin repeat protein